MYGSDFDLVINPSEVWWLEFKNGPPAFLLIIDASSSIALAYLFLAFSTL